MDFRFRFSIFLSYKAARRLIEIPRFCSLVKKAAVDIFVDGNVDDILKRLGNPVTTVHIFDGHDTIQDVMANNAYSIHPYSLFVLDITPGEASMIQREYGIFCQSSDSINLDVLFQSRFHVTEEGHLIGKNHTGKFYHTWDNIIEKTLPCNCIVVNDKYLLNQKNFAIGMKNLVTIIRNLMVSSRCLIDVVVVVDLQKDEMNTQETLFRMFSEDIVSNSDWKTVKSRTRIHCISPILPPGEKNPWYSFTHNRRIFTNYCMYSAEYRLCAFTKEKESVDQILNCYPIFSEGLAYNTSFIDQTEYNHRLFMARFAEILYGESKWRLYSCDGVLMEIPQEIPLLLHARDL